MAPQKLTPLKLLVIAYSLSFVLVRVVFTLIQCRNPPPKERVESLCGRLILYISEVSTIKPYGVY
jgi:hypothetical protein